MNNRNRSAMYLLTATGFFYLQAGCVANLAGAGRYGVGYASESTAFFYHEVDGDKNEASARSELDLDPLLDMLLQWKASGADPEVEAEVPEDDSGEGTP